MMMQRPQQVPSLLSSSCVKASIRLVLILIACPWLFTYLHLTSYFKNEGLILVSSSSSTGGSRIENDIEYLPDGIYHIVPQFGRTNDKADFQRVWQSKCTPAFAGYNGNYEEHKRDDPFCNSFIFPSIVQLTSHLLPLVKSRARLITKSLGFHQLISAQKTVFWLQYHEETSQWLFLMDQPKIGTPQNAAIQLGSYSPPPPPPTTSTSSSVVLSPSYFPPSGTWVFNHHPQQQQQPGQQPLTSPHHLHVEVISFESYNYGRAIPTQLKPERSTYQKTGTFESPSISSSSSAGYGFRRNPNKSRNSGNSRGSSSPLWKQLTEFPATTFWMMVNIGLYLIYWNKQVPVTSVALNHHVWNDHGRAFSGSLAHFEIWHIGFNMMSMHTLGQELEPIYGSIPFFLYNFSLIPITTLIQLAMMIIQQRYQHRVQLLRQDPQDDTGNRGDVLAVESLPHHNIVGYSGVLFAWMVVATLQPTRGDSCPIPFIPSLCFQTYSLLGGYVSFNFGPFVTLVFAQVILPRAAFMGHLAGIVAGFALHWKLLPLEWMAQPSILIPAVWIYSKLLRQEQLLNWTTLRNSFGCNNGLRLTSNPSTTAIHRGFQWVHNAIVALLLCFLFLTPLQNMMGMVLPHIFLWIILHCMLRWMGTEADCLNHQQHHEYNRVLGVIGRGFVVILVVIIVTDTMTFSGWFVTSALWKMKGNSSVFSLLSFWLGQQQWKLCHFFPFLVSLRLFLLLIALCLTCHLLGNASEIGTSDTIFVRVLGWCALEPAQNVGSRLVFQKVEDDGNVFFPGRGISLGGGNDQSPPPTSTSHQATTRSVNRRGESSTLSNLL